MGYQYSFFNKQVTDSATNYTLSLEDSNNVLPLIRIEKSFKTDDEVIDSEFLKKVAKAEIERVLQEPSVSVIKEVSPEDAEGDNG